MLIHDPANPDRRLHKNVGYFELSTTGGFWLVHRLVATAFHGPPPSPIHQCHHIDSRRDNTEADNLMWVTPLEHAAIHAGQH